MVLEPRVSPAFAITYFCNHCNIRFENTSKYVDTLTFFPKTWTKGHLSLDDLWPHVLVWLYPRIIVSKSHGNTSMYVDTVINSANYHIHTYIHTHTYILRTYYVQNEWSHSLLLNSVQARQKIWRYNSSPSYVMARWPPQSIPPFEFPWSFMAFMHPSELFQNLFVHTLISINLHKFYSENSKNKIISGHKDTRIPLICIVLYAGGTSCRNSCFYPDAIQIWEFKNCIKNHFHGFLSHCNV